MVQPFVKRSATDVLELDTPIWSSRTKILRCSGLNNQIFHRVNRSQTLYQSTALELNHSPVETHYTFR